MSRFKGKQIEDIEVDNAAAAAIYQPRIKWLGKKKVFVLNVLNMYEKNGDFYNVEISELDLYRLINADRGAKWGFWFDADEEKGDLDDDTYLGISYIQARWYLSISVLKEAKRLWKRAGKTGQSWLVLKKRVAKGGRPVGGGKKKKFETLSVKEQERIKELAERYDEVVLNCYAKDWVREYIELEKDMALFKGEKFIGKRACIEKFRVERGKYLEENTLEEIRKRTRTL